MDLEERLDEYKTRYRNASLPDEVRQPYDQILTFVDAATDPEPIVTFSGELASQLTSELDVLFPASDESVEIEELIETPGQDLQDFLREYKQLEGDVTEAILDTLPGEGDETLCILPAPFRLTDDDQIDPGLLGDVIENLLGQFSHPTLLLRQPPHNPSEDLYDHVVVAASTLHNLLRLVRCTAGLCPDESTIKIMAVADERFTESMKQLLEESEDFSTDKSGEKLQATLIEGMQRKLRHIEEQLDSKYAMDIEFDIHEGTIESATEQSPYFDVEPTLLSVPLHYSGGGYSREALQPLFKRHQTSEILTI